MSRFGVFKCPPGGYLCCKYMSDCEQCTVWPKKRALFTASGRHSPLTLARWRRPRRQADSETNPDAALVPVSARLAEPAARADGVITAGRRWRMRLWTPVVGLGGGSRRRANCSCKTTPSEMQLLQLLATASKLDAGSWHGMAIAPAV
eukprot:4500581-Prymnesium_polylepis.1